ncbi:MAG: Uma2 family endonuclease [Cyanobacteria bacterium P01_F01_bin.150]
MQGDRDINSGASNYQIKNIFKEYVLVSQDRQRVEVFRKNDAGQWVLYSVGPGDDITLTSVGWTVAIAAFYEDVELLADTGSA